MSPPAASPMDRLKSYLPLASLAAGLLIALGFLANPVAALNERIAKVEAQVAAQETAIQEVRRYARAAAIDLCLTRPDSTLYRMQLNCRQLLSQ